MKDIQNATSEKLLLTPLVNGFENKAESRVLTDEHIFAEKLHAYMRHSPEHQARVKDFADLVLLSQRKLDFAECKRLISEVFQFWLNDVAKRGARSLPPIPVSANELHPPPEEWREPYQKIARDLHINENMEQAFLMVHRQLESILIARV